MGEILAVVGLVVAIAAIVELERLRRTVERSAARFDEPLGQIAAGARTYQRRNASRLAKLTRRDTSRPQPEIDAKPARQVGLRVTREVPDDSVSP